MSQRFGAKIFFGKINTVILNRYLGIDFNKIDKYFDIFIIKTRTLFIKPKIDKITLEVNQKVILQLEKQRQIKLTNNLDAPKFLMHNILINNGDKKLKGKIRIKGDRAIHWQNRNTTSYKIDMRKNYRIWGLEEFSIQKPITRNYIYEYIFHKFLEFNNLISLKYFFINLKMNDIDQGIYAVEEGFSKELVERNKKRNGPIFGLEETKGEIYPDIEHDLYSTEYWVANFPDLTNSALSKLEEIKQTNSDFSKYFDLNKSQYANGT